GGLPPERHGHRALVGAAVELEFDLVSRLVLGENVAKLVDRRDARPAGGHDQVAAEAVVGAGHDDRRIAAPDAGPRRRAAFLDAFDEQPPVDRKPDDTRQVGPDLLQLHAEIGVLDLARAENLRHDRLDGVGRDCEADTDVAAARRLDLRVDADYLAE